MRGGIKRTPQTHPTQPASPDTKAKRQNNKPQTTGRNRQTIGDSPHLFGRGSKDRQEKRAANRQKD